MAIAIAIATAFAGRAAAQGTTTGAVAGRVTDTTGIGIPDAEITVTNRNTGFVVHAVTRTNGQYFVQGLTVGNSFRITARRIGFGAQSKDVNNIVLEQVTPVDFTLFTEVVTLSTVRTEANPTPTVSEAARNGVGTLIDERAVATLPSLDRNFTDFVTLTPEVSSTNELGGFSAAGENPHYNSIQIDGSTEADLFGLGSTGQPGGQAGAKSIPIESILQYQVLVSPFDVRDGQFSGALINAITKSGTNDFHGSAYYFYRNQAIGRTQPYLPNYNESQYGFSLGGPIIKNRVFFFVNPEFQTEASPATGPTVGQLSAGAQADLAQFTQLASQYGFATGSAGAVTNRHPLSNLFARLDFNLPFNTNLVIRNNYAHADKDEFSRTITSFSLTSQAYTYESTKNATTVELNTNFAGGGFNELIATYELIREPRQGYGHSPQLEVIDPTYNVDFYTGTQYASQGNILNQDLFEIRDNVTVPIGNHSVTLGTQDQFFKAHNYFAEYSYSAWTFESLDSLANGGPAHSYRIGVPAPNGGTVQFHTDNIAFYAQDQWQVTPRFELTYGIRFDIPIWLDKPPFNSALDTSSVGFINNSQLPSGQVEFSPRVGFNYDITPDHNNPLHGGVGVFSGPPAYVWLSNSFQNSGSIGYNQLTCSSTGKPAPVLTNGTVTNPPTTCANGVGAAAGGEIDYTDKNFKYPQDLKASLTYDPHLPFGVVGKLSYLFTHAIYAPIFQNAALAGPIGTGPYGNAIYGNTPNNAALNIPNRTEIIELTNTNKNWSYDITGGLAKQFSRVLDASIYYTYAQARDVQSVTSTTSASSYTYSWSPYWNQSQQRLGISNFQTPHKITANLTYEMPWHTIIAATYIGTSGQPYTLTYGFDANGDGISGNDPIFVPKNVSDPNQINFAPSKTLTVAQEQQLMQTFLNENPCLARQEGHFMSRNSCSTPWQNMMNVSLQQGIHFLHTNAVTLHCEVFNFLNLLSKNWGQVYEGEGSESLLNQPATGGVIPTGSSLVTTRPNVNFTSLNNPGKLLDPVASNWQMQFGVRYAF